MKKINNNIYYITSSLLSFIFILQQISFAQDTLVTTASNNSKTTTHAAFCYMQPLAWIAVGVIILIILIAMFSSDKKSLDKVVITKPVSKDIN